MQSKTDWKRQPQHRVKLKVSIYDNQDNRMGLKKQDGVYA